MADPAAPDGTTPAQASEGPQQRPADAPATTTAPGPTDATPSEPGTFDLLPGEFTPHLPHGPGSDEPSREVPTGVEPPLPLPREPDGAAAPISHVARAVPDAAAAGLAPEVTLPDLQPSPAAPVIAPVPGGIAAPAIEADRPSAETHPVRPHARAPAPPADPTTRIEPLADTPPIQVRTRLTVTPLGPALRFALRGPETVAAAVTGALGTEAPAFLRASQAGEVACLMLGPDEWLLLAPDGDAAALFARLDGASAEPHSLVDVSHRNTGLTVTGALAAEVLNSGCPLDLDLSAFPVGMATRTLFAKAEIVLWRTGPDAFRIEVWRSYAPYLYGLLAETARDHHR